MRSGMRPTDAFKIRLKADIIPRERIHIEIHNRFRERGVDHQEGVHRWRSRGVDSKEEGLNGEIPADVVRGGVGESDILEATGGNLEVVCWITPRSNTVKSGVGKQRRVIEVRGIYLCVRTIVRSTWSEVSSPFVQSQ